MGVNKMDWDPGITKRIATVSCAILIAYSAPLGAQTAPSEPIPEPTPSVKGFSLPPGSRTTPPRPAPIGPAEEPAAPPVTSSPPSSVPAARTPAARTPIPAPQPAPEQQRPVVRQSEPQPAPPQSRVPVRQIAPEQSASPAARPPAITDGEPAALPEEITSLPEAQAPAAPPAVAKQPAATEPGIINMVLLGVGAAILMLGGLGFVFWRRRKTAGQPTEESFSVLIEDAEPARAPVAVPTRPTEKTTVKPVTRLVDDKPKIQETASGFVTTKINRLQTNGQLVSRPAPATPEFSEKLAITFTAERASSTLLNAVVGYQIEIKNVAGKSINGVQISGTMIQADNNIAQSAASSQGVVMHDIARLSAGQSETVTGDIRLPLNAFQPIDFQSQKLFVPLVLLRFDYFDEAGNSFMQAANFLVGAEHNPPREKMAPFRLDLGPRSFGKVAQRIFQS